MLQLLVLNWRSLNCAVLCCGEEECLSIRDDEPRGPGEPFPQGEERGGKDITTPSVVMERIASFPRSSERETGGKERERKAG